MTDNINEAKKLDKISIEIKKTLPKTIKDKKLKEIINEDEELKKLLAKICEDYNKTHIIEIDDYRVLINICFEELSNRLIKNYIEMEDFAIINPNEVYEDDMDEDIVYDGFIQNTEKSYERDIKKIPLLTPEEETELFIKYREVEGFEKQEIFNKLVQSNLRLVRRIAGFYSRNRMEKMDLIQEGNIGLIKAINKFNVDYGYKFSTYATWWIRQAVTRSIADQERVIRIPVHFYDKLRIIAAREDEYEKTHEGKKPTMDELCELTGFTKDQIEECIKNGNDCVSLDTPIGEVEHGEQTTLGDFIADESVHVDEDGMKALRNEAIEDALSILREREQNVLKLRFGLVDGRERTLQEIGTEYGLTRERIRQIEKRALFKLKKSKVKNKLKDFE